ncbi:hypothetical protein ACBI99_24485 [Nonomuraea sp. ATR24]|uniref:hypothetical protein n=1 Tax=Nonomuraea sp. ATR24 TaxID=1676744 RepID=UPI0035C09B33
MAIEDQDWWKTLERALEIVERDVRAADLTGALRLIPRGWSVGAQVQYDGCYHGEGLYPEDGGDLVSAIVNVADSTQETIMELIWQVWPVCVPHDRGAHAGWEDGAAVWKCAAGGSHVLARIGELPS